MGRILKILAKAQEWLMIAIRYLGVALRIVKRTEEEIKSDNNQGQ